MSTVRIGAAAVDDIAAAWFAASGSQPGLAYGVVADGELVHAGGLGERWIGGPAPDAETVFRIASMTKSFTAALVLALRDAGELTLDDAAASYVPELTGLRLPAPDCPPVTIRHLLTMTAGFPADDPWGDRQQGLDPAEFARMLADGEIRYAWAPSTRFEYSNVGYAILGRVIESVTRQDYAQAVRARILTPLRLDRTGYAVGQFESGQLARGHRRDGESWLELQPDPYGAFAPMGGAFSCVRDLARWVAGLAAAFPPRALDSPAGSAAGVPGWPGRTVDESHPLRRATRREMQFPHVTIPAGGDGTAIRFGGLPRISYGFGLFWEDDPSFGDIVQHSGGYPGFGSNMRWHPASGLGVIVLANGTYAPAGALASELLAALLTAETSAADGASCRVLGPAPDRGGPWPETLAARDSVDGLLRHWDDDLAARLFAPNVDLDRPLAERRADLARLAERIGPFGGNGDRPAECDSPAHCRWWLTGPGGTVAVQIRLAPLNRTLVQQLIVAVPPDPASPLGRTLAAVVGLITAGVAGWPAGVATGGGLRTDDVLRQLRMAAAWAGPVKLDCYLAGNGTTGTTVRLIGAAGRVELALDVGGSGELVRTGISLGS